MLTKVRIEVEEQTVAETVDALARYESAIMTAEAQRFDAQWPHEYVADPLSHEARPLEPRRVDPEPMYHWDLESLPDYALQLGRELIEEVIEYDPSLPGWKGRIVVAYRRLDGRESHFVTLDSNHWVESGSGTGGESTFSVRLTGVEIGPSLE